jgi:hypothetical protein
LNYDLRWRNFGIMWAFIIFNVFGAVLFYWLARVPKKPKEEAEPAIENAGPGTSNSKSSDDATLAGVESTEKHGHAQTASTSSADTKPAGGAGDAQAVPSSEVTTEK